MYASQEELINICQEIIEMINTDPRLIWEKDHDPIAVIRDIEEIANGYWKST